MNNKFFFFSEGKVLALPSRLQITLQHILQFITGADVIPMFGFDIPPTIQFCHNPTITLPTANTCSLTLTLPTACRDDTFASKMTFGIANCIGFGTL